MVDRATPYVKFTCAEFLIAMCMCGHTYSFPIIYVVVGFHTLIGVCVNAQLCVNLERKLCYRCGVFEVENGTGTFPCKCLVFV